MSARTFSRLWDRLLSEGVVTITAQELAERAGTTMGATYRAVHDAKEAGVLFSPAKGLYVLVPPSHRARGIVPPDWYIDDMMRHMQRTYYLGFLTAAARLGASHQASQLFRVVVDMKTRDRDIGPSRLRFHVTSSIQDRPTRTIMGPTGRLVVATPETCVLDLAESPGLGGGLGVILEVVPELEIDEEALTLAAKDRSRAAVRRCGWILSVTHPELGLERLREAAAPNPYHPTLVVPGGRASQGQVDDTWGVRVNTMVAEQ